MLHNNRGAGLKSVGYQDEGQSLVEFALTLPVLLLVFTGITTFGLAIQ